MRKLFQIGSRRPEPVARKDLPVALFPGTMEVVKARLGGTE